MATSGLIMLLYLVAHMIGNLKIFAGRQTFNSYANWLRTMGEPAIPRRTILTVIEIVLVVCVVAHVTSAVQLWRRAQRARPHNRDYTTRTMRWGGVIVGLFVVYHLLDITFRVANPLGAAHDPYDNVVASFQQWPVTAFYVLALIAIGFHIRHGITSAMASLGVSHPVIPVAADTFAFLLTVGFLVVPFAVLIGAVS
ncbi:MAG: succinate dehydrogenase cytochrome b subunit [Mycobacterium sp.]|nr:succinate dehydrogenase cytochrome b subunit [Mycobacterium sp.]